MILALSSQISAGLSVNWRTYFFGNGSDNPLQFIAYFYLYIRFQQAHVLKGIKQASCSCCIDRSKFYDCICDPSDPPVCPYHFVVGRHGHEKGPAPSRLRNVKAG